MKSSRQDGPWTVGEIAARFELATHVLRHWEDVGLLEPARDSAGRRKYVGEDLVRVAVIVRSKDSGMTLDQIRVMLDSDSADRHRMLDEHIADLDRRMEEMKRSREMALHAMSCRAHDVANCPGFKAFVADLVGA